LEIGLSFGDVSLRWRSNSIDKNPSPFRIMAILDIQPAAALAMTIPGDTSMALLKEVEALVKGGSARVR
jgi:hypothetical protein